MKTRIPNLYLSGEGNLCDRSVDVGTNRRGRTRNKGMKKLNGG